MRHALLRLEPVIWLLFGAGIMLGTLLLPGYLLTVTLAAPLGLLPEAALDYDRARQLATNPLGSLVLLALIALPLWKGAHHLRSLWIDLVGASSEAAVATLLYLVALVGSLLGILAVVRL